MNIKIIETGEIKKLCLIDAETGIDWADDFLVKNGELPEYVAGYYLMNQEQYSWWWELVAQYQQIGDRYHRLCKALDANQQNKLATDIRGVVHTFNKLQDQETDFDIWHIPAAMAAICNWYEKYVTDATEDDGATYKLNDKVVEENRMRIAFQSDWLFKI